MSTRLAHSAGGFIRSIQMSSEDVVLLVEGVGDRAFYSGVAREALPNVLTRVVTTAELQGFTKASGKPALIDTFKQLKKSGVLKTSLAGGPTKTFVVILDKDIDDRRRRKLRSPHVVYTVHYNVENHIFEAADVAKAVSCACSLDLEAVASALGHQEQWRRSIGRDWAEWTAYCYAVHRNSVGVQGYGRDKSMFHPRAGDPIDSATQQTIVSHATLIDANFPRYLRTARRVIAEVLARDAHDLVFNGKWYVPWLAHLADRAANGAPYPKASAAHFRACALATINYASAVLAEVVRRIRTAVHGTAAGPAAAPSANSP
ncbi:hypothetical protein [Sandaracinus amylolyticus]|uniref:hypothetical protein n=1 Tax=Sandaracinus amylolyticus TaxID=927083 RepID=UPI001F3DDF68|nr:hypothetical protein [Sandaracinus amylolyticus]UJR85255.1 Hypothetical protein I5071_73350 [Sandaracinus amylolyticus]